MAPDGAASVVAEGIAAATGATKEKDTAMLSTPPTASRQVAWYTVHEYVTPTLARVGSWPMAGTPQWVALDDNDPRKLAALLDAAQHYALRIDTLQQEQADASHAVRESEDWRAVASRVATGRGAAYIERRAS